MFEEEFNGRVFVPSNLKNNKKAVIGKLDLREILFIVIAGSIFALIFFPLNLIAGNSLALIVAILISGPILVSGFIKFDGLKVEEYLIILRMNKVLSNRTRINNADNLYEKYEKITMNEKPKVVKEEKNSLLGIFKNISFGSKLNKRKSKKRIKNVSK